MPTSGAGSWIDKTPELVRAEAAGLEALRRYCYRWGTAARLCRKTGIDQATMSRLRKGEYSISLELALTLEVATKGALRAEVLCPSRANLVRDLLNLRVSSLIRKTS